MRVPSLKRRVISAPDLIVLTIFQPQLDGQALASLGATACEHGTAALSRHAGPEPMALRALAGIRLIGALHFLSLRTCHICRLLQCSRQADACFKLVSRATVRLYYGTSQRQQLSCSSKPPYNRIRRVVKPQHPVFFVFPSSRYKNLIVIVINTVELGKTLKTARGFGKRTPLGLLKKNLLFQMPEKSKKFSHPFPCARPSQLNPLSTRRGPYHAGPLSSPLFCS